MQPGLQVERVTLEAEAARKEAHAQKALARTLQEQQRLMDDEVLQQETTIKDLRNELADKEVALQNAQRKLFQARTSRCGSVQVSTLAAPQWDCRSTDAAAHSVHSLACTSTFCLAPYESPRAQHLDVTVATPMQQYTAFIAAEGPVQAVPALARFACGQTCMPQTIPMHCGEYPEVRVGNWVQ